MEPNTAPVRQYVLTTSPLPSSTMGQYGISIKLWSSQYQASTNEFKVENSVAYMFQDRAMEDMMYISNIVKHLVGDDSLDTIIKDNIPQTQNIVKGEFVRFQNKSIA